MAQWYAQVGTERYGPTSEEEMRSWVEQGRITAGDMVWSEGMANWVAAGEAFPAVRPAMVASSPAYPSVASSYMPHRGAAVLVLGILGLATGCGILGIIAWVMGTKDLRLMAAGQMDRAGESTTKAGRICGIIAALLFIVYLLVVLASA